MIDLLLRNARVAGHDPLTDLGVDRGRMVAVDAGTTAAETIDLGGSLTTPPLVEPHIHLDAVLTVGQPRPNVSGSLFEGIAVWAERVADLTYEDVRSRVRQVLRWQLASGVQHVRSHVDVCDPELRALRALHDLREDLHCDETDDDHARFVEVMVAETIRRGRSGRVTASHTTAMHSYNNAYAHRLIANIARAGLHMVTNPLDNS